MDERLFEVITHLVASAPTSLEETPSLAAFRMVDAAHRLMAIVEGDDAFLAEARADYLDHFNLVMTDQVAFDAWLGEYVRTFTGEALRRTRSNLG
ncbi:DUF6092 family protein [Pseudonocardia sp. TRM90224]|uniref:DUF6092 family protein n=1 Tax=Pseudonocardia sp. TRM90224 TaxID=2812678 RepID=UPI001E54A2D6|nr:DUF6092 family protein [Pseudonocardia sp. TRM90224]